MNSGAALRTARLTAGLTQSELASRSGTSQATISAYEGGDKVPSAATLARVLAAAGVRLTTAAASRPVRTPSAAALERSSRTLGEVIALAAELPTRHRRRLAFPRIPAPPTV